MGRGLSELQRAILDILPDDPRPVPEGRYAGALRPTDIIEALGLPANGTARASVSRALARLSQRGLVLVWQPSFIRWQGNGFRYTKAAPQ